MPAPRKADRYHHGDLRAALVEAAVELIGESGLRGFSLAEASRRLGVAPSAPYAHFPDREALLAAVATHGWQVFHRELLDRLNGAAGAAGQLAQMAACYVRFAGYQRPLFEAVFLAGLDKRDHPQLREAERPVNALLDERVRAAADGDQQAADDLAVAVEALAHGHAMLLIGGDFGSGEGAVEQAAGRAAAATLALIEGRSHLRRPPA